MARKRFFVRANSLWRSARWDTSARTARVSPPIDVAASASVFSSRPLMTTLAARRLNSLAVARPMPLLPPVMTATLFVKALISYSCLAGSRGRATCLPRAEVDLQRKLLPFLSLTAPLYALHLQTPNSEWSARAPCERQVGFSCAASWHVLFNPPSGFLREQDAQLATHGFVERTESWTGAVNGIQRVHETLWRRQWARRIQSVDLRDLAPPSFQGGPE